jgi:hypothetical protein
VKKLSYKFLGERILDNEENNFERGQTDVFGIQCVDLGELKRYKNPKFENVLTFFSLSIRHDNSGFGASWFLDKVIVDSGTGERWYFPCGKWLSDSEDDKQISRDLPAVKEDSQTYTPLMNYQVTVITGDRWGAGTDSGIYLRIVGQNGESREAKLDNAQNNFERGKTDLFGIESTHLGELSKIIVRSDGAGFGSDWFLDKIVIFSELDKKSWFFLCGTWIDKKQGLVRELPAAAADGTSYLPLVKYKVAVTTGTKTKKKIKLILFFLGDRRGASTDATVSITVFGENGDSGTRVLENPEKPFQRGKTDEFGFESVDLGNLTKIRIGHDNAGFSAGWFLEKVVITNEKTGAQFFFLHGRWLAKDEDDGQIEREIPAQDKDGRASAPMITYKVSVLTGDRHGAGTDAKVFVKIFGDKVCDVFSGRFFLTLFQGATGDTLLDNGENNFERGQIDVFGLEFVELGELQKCVYTKKF